MAQTLPVIMSPFGDRVQTGCPGAAPQRPSLHLAEQRQHGSDCVPSSRPGEDTGQSRTKPVESPYITRASSRPGSPLRVGLVYDDVTRDANNELERKTHG